MPKQDASPFLQAAVAFDEALAAYARLGELFLRTPLSSVKHLERANATLSDIASCEERLQAAGQDLVRALSAAREQQEQLAAQVVAHVPTVHERNQRLQELMRELTAVAAEVGGLNTALQGRGNGETSAPPAPAEARDASATVLALSTRAEQLAGAARAAELEELATQAHALHQRLQTIGKKLAKAADG